jgi:small-conductance mechanosensitive channel
MTQIHLNPEILNLLFTIVNTAVLPSWLLLAFAPRWTYTRRFVLLCGVLLMAVTYTVLFAANFSAVMGGGGMSLAGISAGFQNPEIALLGWVHYLSFDMFVGAWEVHDAQTHGVSHWIVVPCLLGTFMAGPVGLLLYMAMRFVRTKQIA